MCLVLTSSDLFRLGDGEILGFQISQGVQKVKDLLCLIVIRSERLLCQDSHFIGNVVLEFNTLVAVHFKVLNEGRLNLLSETRFQFKIGLKPHTCTHVLRTDSEVPQVGICGVAKLLEGTHELNQTL